MSATGLRQHATTLLATITLISATLVMVTAAALIESKLEVLLGKRLGGFIASEDHRTVAVQRLWRHAYWAMGWTLPGTPDLNSLDNRLEAAGFQLGDPVLIRIFKREFLLEVWLKKNNRFERFASYPICRFSGRLGPKLKQGDHQAPEGIYTVAKSQLNPNSRWHKSFNLGFPNLYDRSLGRTGSYLMVHGGCSSIGCYAVTNAAVDEIWRIVTSALNGNQSRFQVHAFPFRMTDANLAERTGHPLYSFWSQLKVASDYFEATGTPPIVDVCGKRYHASPGQPGNDGSRTMTLNCTSSNPVVTN